MKEPIRRECFQDIFDNIVKKYPERIALSKLDEKINYRELDKRASMLAMYLCKIGVDKEKRVCIICERNIETIVGIIAVLKAGGAYVPIDSSIPSTRKKHIICDCLPMAILTGGSFEDDIGLTMPIVDLSDEQYYINEIVRLKRNKPNDLAAIYYTSGTTGVPKGVAIEHSRFLKSIKFYEEDIVFSEHEIVLQFASLSFIASFEEMVMSLLFGGELCLIPYDFILDYQKFEQYIDLHQISAAILSPGYIRNFSALNIKKLLIGGAASINNVLSHISVSAQYYNIYGATEIGFATYWKHVDKIMQRNVPIGIPNRSTKVYILCHNNPCTVMEPGELCIAGEGLARGYLNQPELTAEKFVENPFGEGRMYKTGDMARWMPDGNIEYLGRVDDQIQVRGFRVELGEIENTLRLLDGIKDAAVIAREDADGEKSIYAYLVSDREVSISAVREELGRTLPDYMIPPYMMQIEGIPLNCNRKLDKRALPEIEAGSVREYQAPGSQTEAVLCRIFEDVLGVKRVGVKDNFFELGGHSLRAMRVINAIESETGVRLPLNTLFTHPVIAELAQAVKESVGRYEAIPKAEDKEYYPMSSTQKRMYLINQIIGRGIAYNMPQGMRLEGSVDVERIREAAEKLVCRHEILRTEFLMLNGEPVQHICPQAEVDFRYIEDGSGEEDVLFAEFIQPFDLGKAPLFRLEVVKREGAYLLFMDMHHIVCDGMSMGTFVREFSALYNGEDIEETARQYRDYSEWMGARDISSQKEFWTQEFSDEIPVLNMPLDFSRPKEQSFEGGMVYGKIEDGLWSRLNALSGETGATMYMILLSAAMIELGKYSHQEDIVVGSPVSARVHKDTEHMMGMFVNTLAMRGRPEGKKRYADFLLEIKDTCLNAYENQEYPFEELVEAVEVQRDLSRNPIFDVMLVLQNNEEEEYRLQGMEVDHLIPEDRISKFDLTFNISERGASLEIGLEYCSALYRKDSAAGILEHFIAVLEEITRNPEALIEDMEMVAPWEKERILGEFNDTEADYPREKTVVELFEDQVERTPENTALVYEGREMTYRELNAEANRIALQLRELGVGPDDFVAIIAERSMEMVAGICGIIKAGGAYVPIDPDYPEERIRYIISDCNPKAILTQNYSANVNIPVLDLNKQTLCEKNLKKLVCPDNLAYCIYTSGTTGRPKGSLVEHKSIIRLVKKSNFINLNEKTIILQTGSVAFDASTFEIWGTLLNGGKLVLADTDVLLDYHELESNIEAYKVNVMWLTSALFNQIVHANPKAFDGLSYLLIGGDKLSEAHVRTFKKYNLNTTLINGYGPTENTTFTTTFEIPAEFSSVLIGRPINCTQVYILNNTHLCGIGVPGELCIAGDGLARGYLNRDELTAEKFVANPYGEGRMYKTGDLARWMPDGNIEYLGRIDDQVKIRGFRIELGEVENALRGIDGISDVAVISREDAEGGKSLHAYVVSDGTMSIGALRAELGVTLPDYMIPQYMMQIERLPLTDNGKLDKRALPMIEARSEREYIAPESHTEAVLCRVFEEVLGVQKVGTRDNFFELGGDSIKAIRVVSKIREYGYEAKIKDVMQKPTVESLARTCRIEETVRYEQGEVMGEVPPTPIIREFGRWELKKPEHFNQCVMLRIEEDVTEEGLKKALSALVIHHDVLRSVYRNGKQEILGTKEGKLYDYETIETDGRTKEQVEAECTRIQESIDLWTGPLMKAALICDTPERYLLIVLHHLVVDGVSWRILVEDFHTALSQIKEGKPVVLPPKTASFIEWAQALEEYKDSTQLKSENGYWSRELEASADGKIKTTAGGHSGYGNVNIRFSTAETESLVKDSRKAFTTEINDILLSALGMAMHMVTGQDRLSVSLEGHGREEIHRKINIDRTVGWFTSIYPVVLECTDDVEYSICTTKDRLRGIPNHGMGYGLLQDEVGKAETDIYFNYLGEMDAEYKNVPMPYACGTANAPENKMNGSININGGITGGRLEFILSYDRSSVPDEMADCLAEAYRECLNRIVEFCVEQKETRKTASDYTATALPMTDLREIETQMQRDGKIYDIFELTPLQEGMLFHKLRDAESSRYVVQTVYDINEKMDTDSIKASLRFLCEKHDVLKTMIVYEKLSKPYQVIVKDRQTEYREVDLTGEKDEECRKRVDTIVEEDVRRGFDLQRDSLLRITLIRTGETDSKMIWSLHHIIVDGWCLPILISDFWRYYRLLEDGRNEEELEKQVREEKESAGKFSEYVSWLRKQDKDTAMRYWKERLEGYEGAAAIKPMGGGEDTSETSRVKEIRLGKELTGALKAVSVANGVTVNTIAETAWGIVLQCCNATEDAVFGKVISGRNADVHGIERTVGLFINTIPCRVSTRKGVRISELLKEMQSYGSEEIAYSYSSLAEIQKETVQGKDLIKTLFVFENYYIAEDVHEKLSLMRLVSMREETNYAVTVVAFMEDNQLHIRLMYDPREYLPVDIDVLSARITQVLEEITKNPEALIEDMELVAPWEKERILGEFNDTEADYPREKTVVELFEDQVERTPENTALVYEGREMTYRELNAEANRIALQLRELGVGPDDFVAIIAERSMEMVAGIYGIIKAGGAYVPIDPDYPEERIRYMIEDCRPKAVLVYHAEVETEAPVIDLEGVQECGMPAPGNPEHVNRPGDLVYCIYTSGTTGRPKGVLIEHRTLSNLMMCEYSFIGIPKIRKAAFLTNICFDVATQEIFSTLLSGGTGIIIDRRKEDIYQCQTIFEGYKVDTLFTTPSYFDLLSDAFSSKNRSYLNQVHLAGEEFYIDIRKARHILAEYDNIYNHYGPTETHCATYKKMTLKEIETGCKEIGVPYSNTQIYILQEGQLCGIGVPGELCIAGEGLARGYLNQPELTAEKFVENPFGEGRMYKTGDMARWMPDGNIEYLGRVDDQIKIRGFRIELGEITNRLLECTEIKDAAVIAREDAGGEKSIYAYLVSDREVSISAVREELGRTLPDYMIPPYMMQIEGIPLTSNGKLDRRALPEIEAGSVREYQTPGSQTEAVLCRIFEDVLGVKRVGVKDNFFELGGHSLKAIKLEVEIKKFYGNVTVKDIYEYPTVECLTQYISKEHINKEVRKKTSGIFDIIQKKNKTDVLLNVGPYNNNLNYKGCFYNALFSLLTSYGKNVYKYLTDDVIFYEYQKEAGILVSKYLEMHSLIDLLCEDNIQVNKERCCKDIIKNIMESIDKGNPIILFYDPYYISIRQDAYNKRHMMHSVLVNGYSKEDKLVYVLEHKNWESLFYEQVTISFREIEDAYQFGTSENEGDFTYYDFHVNESIPITQGVLRKKYCNMIYENKEVILKGIENFKLFLNDYEKIVFEEPKRKETYEKFLEVFSRIINTKRVEQQRIDYLFGKNSEHSKIIEEIVNLWERVRTYIGRYIFSGKYSNKDMTKSIDLLKEIIFEEENFFNAFTPNL